MNLEEPEIRQTSSMVFVMVIQGISSEDGAFKEVVKGTTFTPFIRLLTQFESLTFAYISEKIIFPHNEIYCVGRSKR